jgi:hypothetical protein
MSDEAIVDDVVDSAPDAAVESAPDSPVQSAPEPASEPVAPQSVGVYEAFRSLPQFSGRDDREIAQSLYAAMEREQAATKALAQYRQAMPVVQEYMANRPEFEKWQASLRQPQQQPVAPQAAATPEQSKWWNPPQVRDAYKRYLVRDESGREVIHPDAPLDARHTLTEFLQYKADFAQKFLTDPETALGPMVEQMARSQAENIVRQQFEEVSRQNYVASLEEQNRDWLFDPQTGDVSREGQIVQKYIEEAKSLGIVSPQARWQYALNNTERELLLEVRATQEQQATRSQFEQQLEAVKQTPVAPAPQPAMSQAESNMDYLRRAASRAPSRAGVATNSPQVARQGLSFQDRLKQQLSEEGLM